MLMRVILLFLVLIPFVSGAQDQLYMLNGKIIPGKVISYDSTYLDFKFKKRKSYTQEKIERYRIYSYKDSIGTETILYQQDSILGNFMSLEEATYYVTGEQDAYASFNPKLTKITGFAFGFGVSLFDTYNPKYVKDTPGAGFFEGFFRSEPGLVHILIPFVFPILAGIPGITFDLSKVSNRSYLIEDPYREGFARVVKTKRRFAGLKFSLIGAGAGIGMYFIGKAIQ